MGDLTDGPMFNKKRAFLDLNDKTDNMVLEEQQLTYLPIAFKEFLELKSEYEKWNLEFQVEMGDKSGVKAKHVYVNFEVPPCEIRIPKDEGEADEDEDPLDW